MLLQRNSSIAKTAQKNTAQATAQSFARLFGFGMATRARRNRRDVFVEPLEQRLVLAFDPTAQEQELLELVNAMRADPQGHLKTLFNTTNPLVSPDADVNMNLQFFNVTSASFLPDWQKLTPANPLTWNEALYNSTRTHNLLVLQNDSQSHQFPGEPAVGQRITDAGYTNGSAFGENLFSFSKNVFHGHSGLAIDWGVPDYGHRLQMMSTGLTEIGISIIAQTQTGKNVGPLAVAQNFGNTFNPKTYITGVAFNDNDNNGRYTAGEGLGGVTITVTGGGQTYTGTTMTAGGYRVEVPNGTYTVTFSGGSLTAPRVYSNIVINGANKKVDGAAATVQTPPGPDTSGKPYFIAAVGSNLPSDMQNGQLVSALLATGPASTGGLALTAVDKTLGTWQYTLVANPGAADWINVDAAGALSETNALLLPDTARLRFSTTLKPHHTGTTAAGFLPLETKLDSGLSYRSWDKTAGTAGGRGNATTGGAFGGTSQTAQVYFEARLFRSFNPNAELNVYTLQAEFEVLTSQFGYQNRSTDAFTGFTVFLSALPASAPTAPLLRLYFPNQFNDDGTTTDMGYRYLTPNSGEAASLEGLGRADKRSERDGAYFRELGVNNATSALGYIYTTAQPGYTQMSQVYRTDQFDKPRRQGNTVVGSAKQEQGDHVYTTIAAFETAKKGTWRQESDRGFVRELSTSQGRAAGSAVPVQAPLTVAGVSTDETTASFVASVSPVAAPVFISLTTTDSVSSLIALSSSVPTASDDSPASTVTETNQPLPALTFSDSGDSDTATGELDQVFSSITDDLL